MAAAERGQLPRRGRRLRTGLIVAAALAPVVAGLVLLGGQAASGDPQRVRTFGPAKVVVPPGWEAPPSRPRPDPQEAFELRRTEGGQVVAAAVLLNATFDVEAAALQNGGLIVGRSSRQVGTERVEMVESTNLSHWRYLDVPVPSVGLTVSFRWDPQRGSRQQMQKILDGLSLSGPSTNPSPMFPTDLGGK
jgi:hypothetical protein